jgi:hypothetical protein
MKYHSLLPVLFLLLWLVYGCTDKQQHQDKSDLVIGIKVYYIDRELKPLFEELDVLGINTVLASASLFDDQFTALAIKHDIETSFFGRVFLVLGATGRKI